METSQIIEKFRWNRGKFERQAVEAAVARREEITPQLLGMLEDTIERAPQLAAEGNYIGHLYAMYLLAQFRETRAYPLVLRFALLPGDLLESLCSDFIHRGLDSVLASVCGGDRLGIQYLVENEAADEWVRGAALGCLVTLVGAGQANRDEIVSYFASLFRGKLERKSSIAWGELVDCANDLYPEELMEDIQRAYEDRLIEPFQVSPEEVQHNLSAGKQAVLARLPIGVRYRLVDDAAEEMSWWDCFEEEPDQDPALKQAAAPFVRADPKNGRNDPCPCGSGKKYKKCCGS